MINVRSTSQAKCIISGEHSSIYGHPALVGTLNLYMTVDGIYEFKEDKNEILILILNAEYRN